MVNTDIKTIIFHLIDYIKYQSKGVLQLKGRVSMRTAIERKSIKSKRTHSVFTNLSLF